MWKSPREDGPSSAWPGWKWERAEKMVGDPTRSTLQVEADVATGVTGEAGKQF